MNKIRFRKSDCTISHVVAGGRLRRTFSLILTFFKLVCKLLSKCFAFVFVKYLRIISVPKNFWWPPKSRFFWRNFGLRDMIILTNFDHFQDQKFFFDVLKIGLELSRSCFRIILGLKKSSFACVFSSKCWYMTPKIERTQGQILAL